MPTIGHNAAPNPYDATDADVILRQDALVEKILKTPTEKVVPESWEDKEARPQGFELQPDWRVVPNPWEEGGMITAAPIVAEDEDGRGRHFAIIGQRKDVEGFQYYGFLYRLDSDRILMRTSDPDEQIGALPVAWNSLDAKAFLTLAESLLT